MNISLIYFTYTNYRSCDEATQLGAEASPTEQTVTNGARQFEWPNWQLTRDSNAKARSNSKPSKADTAYTTVKHLIMTLELEPGQAVDERELMARLSIGRTPLREAMQRLVHEELIVTVPRRGSWVSELSFADLQEMIDARELIEPPVAARAARRVSQAQIEALHEDVELACEHVEAADYSTGIQLDLEFHRKLAEFSGNRYLARGVDRLNTSMLRYWYVSYVLVGNAAPAFAHHHAILECIERHDSEAAEAAMRDHIGIFRVRMSQAITPPTTG